MLYCVVALDLNHILIIVEKDQFHVIHRNCDADVSAVTVAFFISPCELM